MIEGVKILEQIGKNGDIVKYTYKGYSHWCKLSVFEEMSQKDFDIEYNNAVKVHNEVKAIKKKIKNIPISESEKAIFERWQSEWGYDEEDK